MNVPNWMTPTTALLVVTLAPPVAHAAEERPLAENAALQYWMAFSMLPELTEAESEKFSASGSFSTAEVDDVARGLVGRSGNALGFLRRGAALRNCDWGQDLAKDGPETLLPHLSKARRLAELGCLRARVRLADGQPLEAVQDLGDVFALGRHSAGAESELVSLLVQIAIESKAKGVLETHLDELDADSRRAMAERLSGLPGGGSFERAIRGEQRGLADWMIGQANKDIGAFQKKLAVLTPDAPDVEADEVVAKLRGFRAYYEEMLDLAKLPEDEFEDAWKTFFARADRENEFAAILLPALDKAYLRVKQHQREMAALGKKLREGAE